MEKGRVLKLYALSSSSRIFEKKNSDCRKNTKIVYRITWTSTHGLFPAGPEARCTGALYQIYGFWVLLKLAMIFKNQPDVHVNFAVYSL